ncbi:MAG: acyltransferase family protein [Dysgonomonas sp.]
MNLSLYKLDRNQINIIKGIAIVIIVLHNFLHVISGVKENDISYDLNEFLRFLSVVADNPLTIFNSVLSYFGHFGVELFVFSSGFGLTKKYMANDKISYKDYIVPRLTKIYSLMLFGLVVIFSILFYKYTFEQMLKISVWFLSMLKNLSYTRIYSDFGVWWFFSLIVQLYLLFPFLYKYIDKKKEQGFYILLIAVYALIYVLFPITERFNIPMFGNFLGHLPEFLLGIAIARLDSLKINIKYVMLALVVFVSANLTGYMFPFGFLSAAILLLFIFYPIYNNSKGRIAKAFLFLGNISMFMFLFNGSLREFTIPFFRGQSPLFITLGSFGHLVFVIVFSYLASIVFNKTMKPLSQKIIKKILHNE